MLFMFRPTAADLLKHKFFTKAKVCILANKNSLISSVLFIYLFLFIFIYLFLKTIYLSQNNEYLQERLLYKGPTISERSKKVWSSLILAQRRCQMVHVEICPRL